MKVMPLQVFVNRIDERVWDIWILASNKLTLWSLFGLN